MPLIFIAILIALLTWTLLPQPEIDTVTIAGDLQK